MAESDKRKPGGQPGHPGKTRKGFGRVDQYELLRPDICPNCGSLEFSQQPVAIQVQQVAQLVERPIEVVEYQRQSCQCVHCGQVHIAAWPQSIVPGQDLGLSLQGLLVWLGNYAHVSYEKQQELLRELGDIDIAVGTLQATNQRMFQAVQPAVNELHRLGATAAPCPCRRVSLACTGGKRVAVGDRGARILPVSRRRYAFACRVVTAVRG